MFGFTFLTFVLCCVYGKAVSSFTITSQEVFNFHNAHLHVMSDMDLELDVYYDMSYVFT